MKVMVDLDGVCYDFGTALREWLIMDGHPQWALPMPLRSWHFYREQWGMTDQEFVDACARGVDAGYLFAVGPVTPGALEGLHALKAAGHTVHLVTDRHFGSYSTANTEGWLQENKLPYDTLTFSGDKTVVDADIYLDDRPKNIDAIRAAGKRAVTFHQRWNAGQAGERVYGWGDFVRLVAKATPTIIGISGYARSGKDTVAASLVANHGFTRVGFADSLKALAYGMNPIVTPDRYVTDGRCAGTVPGERLASLVDRVGWEEAKANLEVRTLLQRLGTEGGRKVLPGIWVEALWKQASGTPNLVIPDVRFPDEAVAVRARGGEVWRVSRPGTAATNAHVSETALDDFDFDRYIANDGDLSDLDARVSTLVASVLKEEALNG